MKYDSSLWLAELMLRKINVFKFQDLPVHLQNRSALHDCSYEGIIREIACNINHQKTWEINTDIRTLKSKRWKTILDSFRRFVNAPRSNLEKEP